MGIIAVTRAAETCDKRDNPSHAGSCIARRLSFREFPGLRLGFLDAKPCIKALLPCRGRRDVVGGRSPPVPFFRPESLFSPEHPSTRLTERTRICWTHALLLAKCDVRPLEMLVCDPRSQVV